MQKETKNDEVQLETPVLLENKPEWKTPDITLYELGTVTASGGACVFESCNGAIAS